MSIYTSKTQPEILQSMLSKFAELRPDVTIPTAGIAGTLMNAVSYYLEENEQLMEDATIQMILNTATGQNLDGLAENYGFIRKVANTSSGSIRFFRLEPSVTDIIIPAGTIVQTKSDQFGSVSQYTTSASVTLLQNTYYVDASITATVGGLSQNVDGGSTAVHTHGTGNSTLVFTSNIPGSAGNLVSVQITNTGTEGVSYSGTSVFITINEGVTTVNAIKAIIELDPIVSSLLSLSLGAGNGTGFISALPFTFLAGGSNGQITIISSFISNVDGATNISAITGGYDEETDTDFRARIRDGLSQNYGKTTNSGYERLAREVANVTTAKVVSYATTIASLVPGTGNAGLVFSAKSYGSYGNSITITCTHTGTLGVSITGLDITITIDSGVTTASDIKALIESNAVINSIISVYNVGDGTGFFVPFTITSLVGGNGDGKKPNEFDLYITENTVDGFPNVALISEVQTLVNLPENRSPNDIITVLSPVAIDIVVDVLITEYTLDANQASVRANVETDLLAYIAGLPTGTNVYINNISKVITEVVGVKDFVINSPIANATVYEYEKIRLTSVNCTIA